MNEELLILFATTTGNAEEGAKTLAERLKAAGLKPRLANMYGSKPGLLSEVRRAAFVVSTWGDGEPPDDALSFWEHFVELSEGALPNLEFAVFGLGDSSYDDFCGFGKKLDAHLETCGATRLLERADADVEFEDDLETWADALANLLATRKQQAA